MKLPRLPGRTLALVAIIVPLLALFAYAVLRAGPMAPVAVTVTTVQARALAPALSGIGTVQARFTHRIGPTFAGRLKQLHVDVGDTVQAGQLLGEMDPVDLDERLRAQQAATRSAEAALRQADARRTYARTQASRYQQLFAVQGTSEEMLLTKQQESSVADAALAAAREDLGRLRAEAKALGAQRSNLGLRTPVGGLVALRHADPGTTVVAGQAVVEVIDPASLWIDTRFDQISASGLAAGLPAEVRMRSRQGQPLAAQVLRTEPLADAVTEEMLAKIVFEQVPAPLPPVGELAEVTVRLPALPEAPTIPNAAIRALDGQRGVWKLVDAELVFTPVRIGRADLDGNLQVASGLDAGDRIIVYSERTLGTRSRIQVVERIAGVAP